MIKKSFFQKYYIQFLILIVAFTFLSRTYRLNIPEKYVFDEVYHAVTAKLILHSDQRAYEWNNPPPEPNTSVDWLHPPYAKLIQALSMAIFGENSFGWRFSSVIFGSLVVLITAKIAEEIITKIEMSNQINLNNKFLEKIYKEENKYKIALLSSFLVSLDGLLFTMSRIAMNDVHTTFFILLSLWFYLKYINNQRKLFKLFLFSSLAGGFAVGSKWSGIFVIGIIGISESIHTLKYLFQKINISKIANWNVNKDVWKYLIKQIIKIIFCCLIIPAILYLSSYSQMFLQGKDFNHLIEMHKNIWWYQTTLNATHPAQSKPLQWFLNIKPVWFHVTYQKYSRADIYAIGNPALFLLGGISIITTFLYFLTKLIIKLLNYKFDLKINILNKINAPQLLGFLFFSYLMLWTPWILSPRIMFFYHYLPAVPLLSINLAFWLFIMGQNKYLKWIVLLAVLNIILCFAILYPHMTLIQIPNEIKNNIYFMFDFWKQA